MEIEYSDGRAVEAKILKHLSAASDLTSVHPIAHEHYSEWAVKYHLCPERGNLLRHLDFKGLDVLELGAGMGGVSRYLAESARSLTVVEGTEARFAALSSRLRDLDNWSGTVGNIQNFQTDQRFDVVCVIGVLEYSEIYVTPPMGSTESPFSLFLKQATSFLKPGGVLILAIENKLGLKYWSGVAEDHTGNLFDGIAGYPLRKSPKTFSRKELVALVNDVGLRSVEEQYPFPDYKIPSTVITRRLVDSAPELAADLASFHRFENYTSLKVSYFPDSLGIRNVARAGLLPDFANSFLFIAAPESKSPIRARLLRATEKESEIAWHYSVSRAVPTKTTFVQKGLGPIQVKKAPLSGQSAAMEQAFDYEGSRLVWRGSEPAEVASGMKLRTLFANRAYFEDWDRFLADMKSFLGWSFRRWALANGKGKTHMSGGAIDALWTNAAIASDERTPVFSDFELFDLEWALEAPLRKSGFILRNVMVFVSEFDLFSSRAPFASLRALYEDLCASLDVTSDFEGDLLSESKLQAITSEQPDSAHHEAELRKIFGLPFGPPRFPREPSREHDLRSRCQHLEAKVENLEAIHRELNAKLQDYHSILNRLHHRLAGRLSGEIGKVPVLRGALKAAARLLAK